MRVPVGSNNRRDFTPSEFCAMVLKSRYTQNFTLVQPLRCEKLLHLYCFVFQFLRLKFTVYVAAPA